MSKNLENRLRDFFKKPGKIGCIFNLSFLGVDALEAAAAGEFYFKWETFRQRSFGRFVALREPSNS